MGLWGWVTDLAEKGLVLSMMLSEIWIGIHLVLWEEPTSGLTPFKFPRPAACFFHKVGIVPMFLHTRLSIVRGDRYEGYPSVKTPWNQGHMQLPRGPPVQPWPSEKVPGSPFCP